MIIRSVLRSILIFFIYIKIIQTDYHQHNKMSWFIEGGSIYYIETRPNFTSSEAQKECMEKDMMYTISAALAEFISTSITDIYGNASTLWTYENHLRSNLADLNKPYSAIENTTTSQDKCYKMNTADGKYYEEKCSAQMGFICQAKISGATIFYKNGTTIEVRYNDVNTFCDPQSNNYDDILSMCLIHFFIPPSLLLHWDNNRAGRN